VHRGILSSRASDRSRLEGFESFLQLQRSPLPDQTRLEQRIGLAPLFGQELSQDSHGLTGTLSAVHCRGVSGLRVVCRSASVR
jgi:hypothetical protein